MSRNKHYLDPLLRPNSIAVVGASERPESVGRRTVENLLTGQFPGTIYAVNPGYDSILGIPCFPDLSSLPETVDHVVLTLGDTRVEAALDDTIAHGAKAATMMSTLMLENDTPPLLRDREPLLGELREATFLCSTTYSPQGGHHRGRGRAI